MEEKCYQILFKSTNAERIRTKQGVYKSELKHMVHQTYNSFQMSLQEITNYYSCNIKYLLLKYCKDANLICNIVLEKLSISQNIVNDNSNRWMLRSTVTSGADSLDLQCNRISCSDTYMAVSSVYTKVTHIMN